MIKRPHSSTEALRFRCRKVLADGPNVARVRSEFGQWLRRSTDLEETRLCDVLIAVNEALANAAEFAYRLNRRPGTFTLKAAVRDGRLTVGVADHGSWRSESPLPPQRRRGRGIPLMRTLADGVAIESTIVGTRVRLRFDGVRPARPAGALA